MCSGKDPAGPFLFGVNAVGFSPQVKLGHVGSVTTCFGCKPDKWSKAYVIRSKKRREEVVHSTLH